jgi:hypothetical protein
MNSHFAPCLSHQQAARSKTPESLWQTQLAQDLNALFSCVTLLLSSYSRRDRGLRENEITILQGNENFGVVPKGLVSGILLPPYGPTRNMPSLGSDLIS